MLKLYAWERLNKFMCCSFVINQSSFVKSKFSIDLLDYKFGISLNSKILDSQI